VVALPTGARYLGTSSSTTAAVSTCTGLGTRRFSRGGGCQQPSLACSYLHFDPGLHYRSARGPAQKDQEAQLPLHRSNLEQVADRLYERGEKLEHGMNKIVSSTPI